MLLAADPDRLERMRLLSLQGRVPGSVEYIHGEIGFNYVLSNLQAAIGLAQFEGLDERLRRKRELAARYHAALVQVDDLVVFHEPDWATSNYWLNSVLADPARGRGRDEVMRELAADGIDSRPFFHPIQRLPPYRRFARAALPVSERLHQNGLSLPSSPGLTDAEQDRVIACLLG
jgi:perosamine synthetase